MKIDAAKLEQAIDGMKSVCADGKADIKRLFTEAFDVQFEPKGIDFDVGNKQFHFEFSPEYKSCAFPIE